MIDYGALQPSPVQKPADSSKLPDTNIFRSSISPSQQHTEVCIPQSPSHCNCTDSHLQPKTMPTTLQTPNIISPPTITTTTSNGFPSTFSWNAPDAVPPLEADETFNLDSFDLTNAELEEMMMNATQDFWASFPGEVDVGYP